MLRRPFDRQQKLLQDQTLVLGSRIEELLQFSLEAIQQAQPDRSRQLLGEYQRLKKEESELEFAVLSVLSRQQPMAGDLRFLVTALKVTLELGRVADHAREINQANSHIEQKHTSEMMQLVFRTGQAAILLLRRAIEAFARRDATLAEHIAQQDDQIDQLYRYLTGRLLATIKLQPALAGQSIYLSQIAHQFERIGDRATNICEWVLYSVTGEMIETNTKPAERIQVL